MREKNKKLQQQLIRLSHGVNALSKLLPVASLPEVEQLRRVLERKLIPQLSADYPLLVSVTGGGSTGKSSLFNALVGSSFSTVRSRAGCTRRVLAAIHPSVIGHEGWLDSLFEQFHANARPVQMADPSQIEEQGEPLYALCESVPKNLILLDTPDFDTGTRDGFTNRPAAKEVLAISDVLLYLFNNQTYNNKANTDFVRAALQQVGSRKLILIYRCSRAFSEEEVKEHAEVLLSHLYDDQGIKERAFLGLFREDESDAVAAGGSFPQVRPVDGGKSLMELLCSLDVFQTRADVMRTMLQDALGRIRAIAGLVQRENRRLSVYQDALRLQTNWVSSESLSSFPSAEILTRFMRLWESERPALIRGIHWGCKKLAGVTKGILRLSGRILGTHTPESKSAVSAKDDPSSAFRLQVGASCVELLASLANGTVSVRGSENSPDLGPFISELQILQKDDRSHYQFMKIGDKGEFRADVAMPESLLPFSTLIQKQNADAIRTAFCDEAEKQMPLTRGLDDQLLQIVRTFRQKMGVFDRVKESALALVTALPALLAVTFVLCTPDGGAVTGGILVQLGGLFGLGDLWALLALPASLAVNEADRKLLSRLLSPIFQAWYQEKAKLLAQLFEKHITAPILKACGEFHSQAEKPLAQLLQTLEEIDSPADEKEV